VLERRRNGVARVAVVNWGTTYKREEERRVVTAWWAGFARREEKRRKLYFITVFCRGGKYVGRGH